MWFLPLLVLGAIAAVAASRTPREPAPPARQLTAGPPSPNPPSRAIASGVPVPGPIAVLGEILRIGQIPPPRVVLCAIAEAQSIGRNDLASDIAQHVAPVVHRHQLAKTRQHQRGTCAPQHQRGTCAPPAYERGTCAPRPSPREAQNAPPFAGTPAAQLLETVIVPPAAQGSPQPAAPTQPPVPSTDGANAAAVQPAPVENDLDAMLNADPTRFMELASRGQLPFGQAVPVAPPSAPPEQPTLMPPEAVAQMHEAADRTRALVPGSPLGGVPDDAWRQFVVMLSRESPQFASSRHVGQYRQRRERLAELGIDPAAIHGSATAQRAALDADLCDAHHHAVAGGMLAEHLGRPIALPGREAPEKLTLSGLLGVIQCAGLDGAVGWLEQPNDRRRYPHTTQVFLHTNGVF